MWNEFKEFAGQRPQPRHRRHDRRRFGKIVDALVNDIIMPIIGIAGKADFSNYTSRYRAG